MPPNLISFNTDPQNSFRDAIPERTGKINQIHIKEKLSQLDINLDQIRLGDFDQIGEITARKNRDPGSDHRKIEG